MQAISAYDTFVRASRAVYDHWIDTPPVLDADVYFPMSKLLERNWREMQREALALLDGYCDIPQLHEMMESQSDITVTDAIPWRFLLLRAFGRDHAENQTLCPVTSQLIRSIPGVTTAGISILDPGKHILAHRGPYRGMLRYHLGLVTPSDENGEEQAILRVDDFYYRWREGEGILWDDTFEHEVWNHGSSPRIVLIVDIARPGIPQPLRTLDKVAFFVVSALVGRRQALGRCTATRRNQRHS